ncbi:MAG TPA: ABC transporter permease subunit [Candidatus Dormibacteraeota bacterium]
MVAALGVEVFKLQRRVAVWVCLGILLLIVILLGYLLTWLVLSHPSPQTAAQLPRGVTPEQLKQQIYPAHFVQNTLSGAAQLGGVIMLIVGVLLQGSEYGWGTVKTLFTQQPRRLHVLAAKLLAVAALAMVVSAVLLAVGAGTSYLLATIDGARSPFPSGSTVVKGFLALWLILVFWSWFGVALATLFRQSALAIGLGLAYALVIEGLIFGIAGQFGGDPVRQVQQWFPLANTSYVVGSFGSPSPVADAARAHPYRDATHGVVVVLLYCAGFAVLSGTLFQRRDVTT